MQNEIHETTEGFIFAIVEEQEVREAFKVNESLYFVLYDDDTEALVESEEDIDEAIRNGNKFGAEIGFKSILNLEFKEGEQNRFRNNDFRSFEEWLNDKINVILE